MRNSVLPLSYIGLFASFTNVGFLSAIVTMALSAKSPKFAYGRIDPGPESVSDSFSQDSDVEMTVDDSDSDEVDSDPVCNTRENRLVIAIDF